MIGSGSIGRARTGSDGPARAAVSRSLAEIRRLEARAADSIYGGRPWGLTRGDEVWLCDYGLIAVLVRSDIVRLAEEQTRVDGRFEKVILVQTFGAEPARTPADWGHYLARPGREDAAGPIELRRPSLMAVLDNGPIISALGRDALADVACSLGISLRMLDTREHIVRALYDVESAAALRGLSLEALINPKYSVWLGSG